MDFARGEAEIEVSKLAARVLAAENGTAPAGTSPTGADPTEAGNAADLDSVLWKELADAGLLSLALPTDLGGDELGMLAIGALLTEVGRRAARIPALATLALGVLPVVKSADPGLRAEVLAGVAGGDTILTAALREPSSPMPDEPAAVTTALGLGGTVSG
jgi:alkylation response protein AidB-like acyl-CoA dehydrogenase